MIFIKYKVHVPANVKSSEKVKYIKQSAKTFDSKFLTIKMKMVKNCCYYFQREVELLTGNFQPVAILHKGSPS